MNLVWIKVTDLRLRDHEAIKKAFNKKSNVILVFCLDPYFFESMEFGHIKFDKFKQKFLFQSIINLYQNIKLNRGHLNIYLDSPENVIPNLVDKYDIKNIYHLQDTTFEEINKLKKIKNKIPDTTEIHSLWGNTIFHLQDLPFSIKNMPDIFTHFRKSIDEYNYRNEETVKINKLKNCIEDIDNINEIMCKNDNLDIDLIFEGGEDMAWKRLIYYFYESKLLSTYKSTRNGLIGKDYSSKFSPYLAFGNISAKSIYLEIFKYEEKIEQNESTYWLYFELLWRDFFRFQSLKYGNDIFKITGIKNKLIEWREMNEIALQLFEKWKEGKTGYPYVDANMIEMRKTGFMSNRGRQMVASFLVKDLKIDWRYGAEYFESVLIDYDVASNYGNWNYSAGIGADPRENRYFNVYKQASNYDKDCKFIIKWIPQLKNRNKKDIINCVNLGNYYKKIVKIKNKYLN